MDLKNLDKRFSSFIVLSRKESGLTQMELSERSGVSRNTIAKIESGAVGASLETALKLIAGLGKELIDLSNFLKDKDLKKNFANEVGSDLAEDILSLLD